MSGTTSWGVKTRPFEDLGIKGEWGVQMRGRERRRKDKEEEEEVREQDDSRRRDSGVGRCRSNDEAKQGREETMGRRRRKKRKEIRKPVKKGHGHRLAPSTGGVDKNGEGQWRRIAWQRQKAM